MKINCEMCGKEGLLFKATIEGTPMTVCKACSSHGRVLSAVREVSGRELKKQARVHIAPASQQPKEIMQSIVGNYAQLIRQAREKKGLTQKDFAKMLNERESVVHQLETGHYEPNIDLARKLEKFLHLSLVEEIEEDHTEKIATKSETFTIGDFIKAKKQ